MRRDAQKNFELILMYANQMFTEDGADASMREIARRAGIGMGTLYRHFPDRESLLEAILASGFAGLTEKARLRVAEGVNGDSLVLWARDVIEYTYTYRGVISVMMSAIGNPASPLHQLCSELRSAGAALLEASQKKGIASESLTGEMLFDLIAALAWLKEQPSHSDRSEQLLDLIAEKLLA